jgi:hypothetical protein
MCDLGEGPTLRDYLKYLKREFKLHEQKRKKRRGREEGAGRAKEEEKSRKRGGGEHVYRE